MQIQNCSGVVHGLTRHVFGRHIYHISGNVIIQRSSSLTFKAVRNKKEFEQLLDLLIEGERHVELQLCVFSFHLHKQINTLPLSAFEQCLCRHSFVRIQQRITELSMNVELRVIDCSQWRELCNVGIRSLFASITHTGVVTVRVTFTDYDWPELDVFERLTDALRRLFVFALEESNRDI